ncbi:hypothetical protein [Desulfatibacillum aliphaticivorans]|uniref:hypothetical protein n=1 Tax=Desulfatibacillum aliphaticivorans TaxID=218208 RepID=UPI000483960D|nr:hypothetical protein [Desulfatibacillum aliphaticivorans]
MADSIAIAISVLALAISGVTAWLTLLRRGTVRMTQPTVIFFGPDGSISFKEQPLPKVYLRTLLFSTSKRGRVIQSMHASLTRNESQQNFNIWVHGDDKLVRGSGLFVGETGVAANHHFLTPIDGNSFRFLSGKYCLKVYAHLVGDSKQVLLFCQELDVSSEMAKSLEEPGTGLYFDWGPDSASYLQHIEKRLPSPAPEKLLEALAFVGRDKKDSP